MKIIHPNGSGGVAVITPSGEIPIEEVLAKDVPVEHQKEAQIVEDNAVPADRTFRDAWGVSGKAVVVGMEKARNIHRDRLRAMREPLFGALDVAYQRADETGDAAAKKAVGDKKHALRMVPQDPAIDAAKTPEELASVLPQALLTL